VPRLGVKGSRHVEGIHGLAQGGAPSKWGRPAVIHHHFSPGYRSGRDMGSGFTQRRRCRRV
jgi:hypothetical protein